MKSLLKSLSLLVMLLSSAAYGYGQENYATNVRTMALDDQKLYIDYDVIAEDGTRYFYVSLIINYDGKEVIPNPEHVSGDYGPVSAPGRKIISWNFPSEFMEDTSKIAINVIAINRDYLPRATFKTISTGRNFYAPCEIRFSNNSLYSDQYEWDFGDPNSGAENYSQEENPAHTFSKVGKYTVSLTAYNSGLRMKNTYYETIIVKDRGTTAADFKIVGFDNLSGQKVPVTLEFINESINADRFSWNFGDPQSGPDKNTSTERNPSHKYKYPGHYQIELTARNSLKDITSTKTVEIDLATANSTLPSKNNLTDLSTFKKHRTRKNLWLAAGISSLGAGIYTLTESNRLYDEYKTATEDAADLHSKIKTYDRITPVAFGISALCAVEVVIQATKQSNASDQLSFQLMPLHEGGAAKLTYHF